MKTMVLPINSVNLDFLNPQDQLKNFVFCHDNSHYWLT